ncbi:hypothetical protein M405DRAFT_862595 [Rhizopogon salebrosus TDB-379]|nr:hypothetical protein M405DRAFT_862595 [Rhizopogon salebrosus TDB-379]
MSREDAPLDMQKVIEPNSSSVLGYQLKHNFFHGAQRYGEAIAAFEMMSSKINDGPDTTARQYITSSEAASAIEETIHAQLENASQVLINTHTRRLCDREAQINAFNMSAEYQELISLSIKHADRIELIEPWRYISVDEDAYKLNSVDGILKLQSFCRTAPDGGHRWAWVDTCCIDQTNNAEVQEPVNSMFVWYRHSAPTIVYLSDVPPPFESGALARSVWNKRG